MSSTPLTEQLQFGEHGLLPAVVQDWLDGTVLMVGFMNREAVEETQRTQRVHFWSRSRQTLWKKGETSGHELTVKQLYVDCDTDTLLVKAEPAGPTCHTGTRTCFFTDVTAAVPNASAVSPTPTDSQVATSWGGVLDRLYELVVSRKTQPPEASYVAKLLQAGDDRILKKVIEEAGEVVLAAKNHDRGEVVYELADLWFHTIVMLGHLGIPPRDILQELGRRFGTSGIRPPGDPRA